MHVIMDGVIYQTQAKGGISRIYNEVLPRMCELDDSLYIELLIDKSLRQPLPSCQHIVHRYLPPVRNFMRPHWLWRGLISRVRRLSWRIWVGDGSGGKIWHSTYYTRPSRWNGPQVVMVYDMVHEYFASVFNRRVDEWIRSRKRQCIERADAIICISENTRQDVENYYNVHSIPLHAIHLGYSNVFKSLPQLTKTRRIAPPFFLYIGGRDNYKNFELLIRAYSVWPRRTEVALVVVGKPWLQSEVNLLKELDIQWNVHLLTGVGDKQLCQLYNQALAFVYPSLYEGFGIPLLEAMACGCPVIASHIPSTVEVASECPIYFEPTEKDSLLKAFDVATTAQDSERVKLGLEHVKRYSWDKTAQKTLNVYRTLLKG